MTESMIYAVLNTCILYLIRLTKMNHVIIIFFLKSVIESIIGLVKYDIKFHLFIL